MLLSIDVSLKTPKLCKADACVRIREERLKPRVVCLNTVAIPASFLYKM